MDDAVIREKVGELMSEVHRFPQAKIAGMSAGSDGGISSMKREMSAIEENLDHIRLAIKYLVFDLEATKRENRLLREMLGDV